MEDHGYITPCTIISDMCKALSELTPEQQREFLTASINRKNEQLFGSEPTMQTN